MKNLTIKLRVTILGLLAVGGILLAGLFGIIQMSSFNTKLERDFDQIRHGITTLVDVQTTSIVFKTQVQEWKNLLIRGNNEQDFAKYEKAFAEHEQAVQTGLKKALDSIRQEGDPANAWAIADIEKLIKDHTELGVAYKAALGSFDKADPETGKKSISRSRARTERRQKESARLSPAWKKANSAVSSNKRWPQEPLMRNHAIC